MLMQVMVRRPQTQEAERIREEKVSGWRMGILKRRSLGNCELLL